MADEKQELATTETVEAEEAKHSTKQAYVPVVTPATVESPEDETDNPEEPYLASDMYKRIITLINHFEEDLPETMQAGGRLVSSGNITFSIQDVGFWDPNMIVFYGELSDGSAVELVQHISQLNLLLVAVPRKNPSQPRRVIGFNLKNEPDIVEDTDEDEDLPDLSETPLEDASDDFDEDNDDDDDTIAPDTSLKR